MKADASGSDDASLHALELTGKIQHLRGRADRTCSNGSRSAKERNQGRFHRPIPPQRRKDREISLGHRQHRATRKRRYDKQATPIAGQYP
jgi:hypothetical protein